MTAETLVWLGDAYEEQLLYQCRCEHCKRDGQHEETCGVHAQPATPGTCTRCQSVEQSRELALSHLDDPTNPGCREVEEAPAKSGAEPRVDEVGDDCEIRVGFEASDWSRVHVAIGGGGLQLFMSFDSFAARRMVRTIDRVLHGAHGAAPLRSVRPGVHGLADFKGHSAEMGVRRLGSDRIRIEVLGHQGSAGLVVATTVAERLAVGIDTILARHFWRSGWTGRLAV